MNIQQFRETYVIATKPSILGTECWVHKNKPHISGYVQMQLDTLRGYAHCIAKEISGTPIPDGYECDHLCENKSCCNPEHIEVKLIREHKRRHSSKITHCPKGHEYTPENTFITEYTAKDGYHKVMRNCRTCRNDRFRILNAERRKLPEYKLQVAEGVKRYRERNKEAINIKQKEKYHRMRAALKAQLDTSSNPPQSG